MGSWRRWGASEGGMALASHPQRDDGAKNGYHRLTRGREAEASPLAPRDC
jgi:hypothetical protein